MTMQTDAPLVHQSLDASNRQAREIARLVRDGNMTLDAPYQRGSVWTLEQRRNLVRSWLLGLPVPAVIINRRYGGHFADGDDFEYAAVDGKQRILAAQAWFSGELDVPASWFEPDDIATTHATDDGPYVTHDELTVPGQRYTSNRFLLPMAESRAKTVAEEALIYGLVNGAGTAQTTEDMERAARIAGA